MQVITIEHNNRERYVNVDTLTNLITQYGDARAYAATVSSTTKDLTKQESRRKALMNARNLLLVEIPAHVATLISNVLAAAELATYPFTCQVCNRGFNTVHDLVMHTGEAENIACKAAIEAKLSNV